MGNSRNSKKLKIRLTLLAFTFITTAILYSCTDNKKKIDDSSIFIKKDGDSINDTNTSEIDNKKEEPVNEHIEIDTTNLVRIDSLSELVFENGASYHFMDDSCKFYYECDCCSGIFVFNDDKTFISVSNCMSDESVRQGTYSIDNFELKLSFDNWLLEKKYNYERELDSTATPFFYERQRVKPLELYYFTSKCGDRIKLTDSLEEFIAIQILAEHDETMNELKEQNLLQGGE